MASYLRTPRQQWLAVFLWASILLVLSLIPSGTLPKFDDWTDAIKPDKIGHFLFYAIFAVLLYLPLLAKMAYPGLAAIFIASLFGGLMEVMQATAGTGRAFDLADMLANLLGAAGGAFIANWKYATKEKRIN